MRRRNDAVHTAAMRQFEHLNRLSMLLRTIVQAVYQMMMDIPIPWKNYSSFDFP